jgi:integrase
MPDAVSHGADSRRPVHSGTRRIPGLYERRRADGTTAYEARLRRNGGSPRLILLDAKTKSDAITELRALRVDGKRGDPLRTRSVVPVVEEVATAWIAALTLRVGHRDPSKRVSPRTLALYEQRIRTHVVPTLGTLPINELTVVDLRRLIDKLGRKLAPSTVTAIVSMMSGMLRYATRERLVERNVVRDLDRDDRPGVKRQSEPRYLSADEIALLLAQMTDSFRPVATLCAYAGFRISEALALAWVDVDLNAKTINVRRQLDDDLTLRNETKTPASTAIVPMLPALERELRAHRSRLASVDLRLVKRDALVFTTATAEITEHQRTRANDRSVSTSWGSLVRAQYRPLGGSPAYAGLSSSKEKTLGRLVCTKCARSLRNVVAADNLVCSRHVGNGHLSRRARRRSVPGGAGVTLLAPGRSARQPAPSYSPSRVDEPRRGARPSSSPLSRTTSTSSQSSRQERSRGVRSGTRTATTLSCPSAIRR